MTHEIEALLSFIQQSPSPAHTVAAAAARLCGAGFAELSLAEDWQLAAGGRYFVSVYGTTLLAFTVGDAGPLRMAAAHTDFPCFRLKPAAGLTRAGYGVLNVEPYGGLILRSWLDRPLGLAGRVVLRGADAFHPRAELVDFARPLVTIPSLAIHMDRKVNEEGGLNAQTDMLPLAALLGDMGKDDWWQAALAAALGVTQEEILSYELSTYPFEAGCALGLADELLSSPRLDNLTSVWACLEGLLGASAGSVPAGVRLVALFDNEEVGSRTKQGAGSLVLAEALRRIYEKSGGEAALAQALADGFLLSVDVAHGLHPAHEEKSDPAVRPVLGGGVVIKQAASQAYAGDAEAVAIVRELARLHAIPVQDFVNRSDSRGGSTLGSIASALVPVRTMDVGVPILAMHSARETMAAADEAALISLVRAVLA
ncbi:M18 family aminopeptidase [Selenomonas bovis]|uniref:M18 family aminopeptidase n=1 Tax=Selenomonas bovis TaxID=416586 RepID=UPI003D075FA1